MDIARAAGATLRGILARDGHVSVRTVPDRDAMSPPQLAADTPIPDILEPVVIRLLKTLRDDSDPSIAHGFERGLCERFNRYKPLGGDHRLDDLAAALGTRDGRAVRLGLDDQ